MLRFGHLHGAALGACRPVRVPAWVGRLAAGSFGVAFFNRLRGAGNSRAKRELDWRPDHPTWRDDLL